jgi:hypothetical protein
MDRRPCCAAGDGGVHGWCCARGGKDGDGLNLDPQPCFMALRGALPAPRAADRACARSELQIKPRVDRACAEPDALARRHCHLIHFPHVHRLLISSTKTPLRQKTRARHCPHSGSAQAHRLPTCCETQLGHALQTQSENLAGSRVQQAESWGAAVPNTLRTAPLAWTCALPWLAHRPEAQVGRGERNASTRRGQGGPSARLILLWV